MPACTLFHTVAPGDICRTIAAAATPPITLASFFALNPDVDRACTTLWPGQTVCTGPAPTTEPVGGVTTEPPTIAPGTLTVGQGCTLYHDVKPGDICYTILEQYPDPFTLDAFLTANPSVDATCSNLRAGLSLCVAGTIDQAPGAIEGCVNEEARPGDTCHKIVERTDGLTLETFFSLNPAIRRPACDNLIVGTNYCVAEKPPAPPSPPCLSFCPTTMDGDAFDPVKSTISAYYMTCFYNDPTKEPGAMQRACSYDLTPIKFGGWTTMQMTTSCPHYLPIPQVCSDGPPVPKPCFECPPTGHRADARDNSLSMSYIAGDRLNCRYDDSYWCYYGSQTGVRDNRSSLNVACDLVAKPLSTKPSTCPAFVEPTPDPLQCFECPDQAHYPGMTSPNPLQRGGSTRLDSDMKTWYCTYSVSMGSAGCQYDAQTGALKYESTTGMCDKVGKPVDGRPSQCPVGVNPPSNDEGAAGRHRQRARRGQRRL